LKIFDDHDDSLIDWKPYSSARDVIRSGITAGKNGDGEDVYVGRGSIKGQLTPGSLLVEGNGRSNASVYVEWGYEEHELTSDLEYFAKEKSCDYRWLPSSDGFFALDTIQFSSKNEKLLVGRILNDNSWTVGKVRPGYGIFYGKGHQSKVYEVLKCVMKTSESSEEIEDSEEESEDPEAEQTTESGCKGSSRNCLLIVISLYILRLLMK
jgi:hypothetical protein